MPLKIIVLSALLAQTPAPDYALPEGDYSAVEKRLDDAQEKLVQAGTYSCQKDGANEALARVEREFDRVSAQARVLLGRDLNLKIWVNSCRKEGDGYRFRSLLRAAERRIQKASRVIRAEFADQQKPAKTR